MCGEFLQAWNIPQETICMCILITKHIHCTKQEEVSVVTIVLVAGILVTLCIYSHLLLCTQFPLHFTSTFATWGFLPGRRAHTTSEWSRPVEILLTLGCYCFPSILIERCGNTERCIKESSVHWTCSSWSHCRAVVQFALASQRPSAWSA